MISLDAMPDVLWEGAVRDLRALEIRSLVDRFSARRDYKHCTDVGAAFRLAVRHLQQGGEGPSDKYIFAFSDLVDEPPTASLRRCRRPSRPSVPDEMFPWAELDGVSVSAFWVPPDQTLAWRRAVADHGLAGTFAVYSDSESGEVTITPPPRPDVSMTEAERAARREEVFETAGTVGRVLLYGLGGLVGLVAVLGAINWCVRLIRGGRTPRPVPRPGPRRSIPGAARGPLLVRRPGAQPRRPNGNP